MDWREEEGDAVAGGAIKYKPQYIRRGPYKGGNLYIYASPSPHTLLSIGGFSSFIVLLYILYL